MDIQVKLALGNARGQTGRVAIATGKMRGLSFGVIVVIEGERAAREKKPRQGAVLG